MISVFSCILLGVFSPAGAAGEDDLNADVLVAYQRIVDSPSSSERADDMRALANLLASTQAEGRRDVDDESIRRLSDLLDIDGDTGRFYGAKTLSAVSCSAKSALPKLRDALSKTTPLGPASGLVDIAPSLSPYYEIERAIAKIEGSLSCR